MKYLLSLLVLSASILPVHADCEFGLYSYEARTVEGWRTNNGVYDGDTVWLEFRLGFGINVEKTSTRLYGIDAIERYDSGGLEARDYLASLLPENEWFMVNSIKDERGKYGRVLVELCPDGENSTSANALLVENGHAIWRDY